MGWAGLGWVVGSMRWRDGGVRLVSQGRVIEWIGKGEAIITDCEVCFSEDGGEVISSVRRLRIFINPINPNHKNDTKFFSPG